MADETKKGAKKPFWFFALFEAILFAAACGGAYLVSSNPLQSAGSDGLFLCGAAILLSMLASALLAFLLLTRATALWFLGPVLGFVPFAIVRPDFLMLPLLLLYLLPGLCIALCIRKRVSRLITALSCAVVFGVLFSGFCILAVRLSLGYFTFEALRTLIYGAGDTVKAALLELSAYNAETGGVTSWISEELAEELVNSAIISLPGFALATCFFAAYLETYFTRLALKLCGVLHALYPDGFYPRPTLASAIVFTACLFLSSLFGKLLGIVAYATLYNLANVLSLVFAIVGFDSFARAVGRRRRRGTSTFWLLLFAVLLVSSVFSSGVLGAAQLLLSVLAFFVSILYPVLYFWGLLSVYVGAYRAKKREKR